MGRPITQVHMIGDYDSFTQLSNGFPGSVDERKYRSEELGWWRVDGKPEYISPERHATVKVVQDASSRVEVDYDPWHPSSGWVYSVEEDVSSTDASDIDKSD